MLSRVPGDVEHQVSPLIAANDDTVHDKKKSQTASFSPVVMVLQAHDSPKQNYTTPLRCKDFYSSSNTTCRICHEDDTADSLISPCNCTGSLGRMHKKCLEKWLSMSNTDTCEICKYRFHVVYHTKHLGQWLLSDGAMGPKCFFGDIICLLVLLPLSVMSIYLCAFGAHSYMDKHEWQATGLALLCLFLVVAFVLWSGLTFRFHYLKFREWQRSNLSVQVIVHPQGMQHCEMNSKNEEQRPITSNIVHQERYIQRPESEFSYSIDISSLVIGLNANDITETRV